MLKHKLARVIRNIMHNARVEEEEEIHYVHTASKGL